MTSSPASPDVVQRERVSEGMEASLRRIESKRPAQLFDITKNTSPTKFRPVPGDEHQRVFRCDLLPLEQKTPEFSGEWNDSVFAPLPVQSDEQIVEVYVRPREIESLLNPRPRCPPVSSLTFEVWSVPDPWASNPSTS